MKPENPFSDPLANPETIPSDLNIPDNYVSHTLKTQKPLPPLSWNNWHSELNWLNVAILTLTPVAGFIGAYFTKLRWETAVFSVVYYYVTGLGSFLSTSPSFAVNRFYIKVLLLGTIDFGLIALIMLQSHYNTFWLSLVQARSKVLSSGGLADIVLTIVTPIPTWIPIMPTRASFGPTSAG
jgi:hypothetical protein